MARTLQLGDDGADVKKLQVVLNARAKPRYYPALRTDGRLGPRTMWAYQDLGWALGFLPDTLAHGVTRTAQELLANPSKRSPEQLDRARDRAPRMATRTVAFDGTPCFWMHAKALERARRRGWQGTLNSGDRRKGVAERYGKQSQAKLYACHQNKLATGSCSCSSCNPANPPGRSSHELRSDGAPVFGVPAGHRLHPHQLGLDCSRSDQLIALLRAMGYKVRKPYTSPSEAHHVNFTADPGPIVDVAHSVDEDIADLPPFDFDVPPDVVPMADVLEDTAIVEEPVPVSVAFGENGSTTFADEPAVADQPSAGGDEADDPQAAATEVIEEEPAPLENDLPALDGIEDDLSLLDDVEPEFDGTAVHLVSAPAAVQGVDISFYQGDVNWQKVRNAGYRFAFVRATYGADDKDSRFGPGRLKAMKDAGIVRGFYHYAYPSGGDALTEARHAVKTIKAAGGFAKGDLPLVLDLEETKLGPAATYKWASDFCKEVKRLTGRGCIVYTGPYFWRDKVGNPPNPPIQGATLWIAHYGVGTPMVPRAWGHRGWSFWQYTSSGACPGVHGRVDLNHFQGSVAEFNALRFT